MAQRRPHFSMRTSSPRSGSFFLVLVACLFLPIARGSAAPATGPTTLPASTHAGTPRGERMVDEYFRNETNDLSSRCLADIKTLTTGPAAARNTAGSLPRCWASGPTPAANRSEDYRHRQARSRRLHRREAPFPIAARPLRHRQPLPAQEPSPAPRRPSSTSAATAT